MNMDEKQAKKIRQRLADEHQKLIDIIHRNRLAEEEINQVHTEDVSDLATISHNKELLLNFREGDFQRLKSIEEARQRLDSGRYGECVRCGEDIAEKRLKAVPWATLCVKCQERNESAKKSRPVLVGFDSQEEEPDEEG